MFPSIWILFPVQWFRESPCGFVTFSGGGVFGTCGFAQIGAWFEYAAVGRGVVVILLLCCVVWCHVVVVMSRGTLVVEVSNASARGNRVTIVHQV